MSDHLLFSGPPGLGKTTLASIVCNELGLHFVSTSGPAINKPGEMVGILSGLNDNSLLFIDEIHRLPISCEEVLYMAMEGRKVDLPVGNGAGTRSVSIPIERFVLVGATTQAGLLSAPLRDRFGFSARLRLYSDEALGVIVRRSSALLGFSEETFGDDAVAMIASRSRGTPRIANTWLRRVRDFALMGQYEMVDGAVADAALTAFGVDELGLDVLGRDILQVLCVSFGGGPVGLNTLAASVGESPETLSEVYEPYLMAKRLIGRTPRGRVATEAAWRHLGLEVPARALLEASSVAQLPFEEEGP
jgi:Holliday junction DNA helicase RuvB